VQNIDLAPTIADAAGARLGPFPSGQRRPDGVSLLPAIMSRGARQPSRPALFEEHRHEQWRNLRWFALRTTDRHPLGRWHYVEWTASGERELYDLDADPWRLHNVAHAHPELVRALRQELRQLRVRFGAAGATAATA
jgi:arylsulfatase A-like enzyme